MRSSERSIGVSGGNNGIWCKKIQLKTRKETDNHYSLMIKRSGKSKRETFFFNTTHTHIRAENDTKWNYKWQADSKLSRMNGSSRPECVWERVEERSGHAPASMQCFLPPHILIHMQERRVIEFPGKILNILMGWYEWVCVCVCEIGNPRFSFFIFGQNRTLLINQFANFLELPLFHPHSAKCQLSGENLSSVILTDDRLVWGVGGGTSYILLLIFLPCLPKHDSAVISATEYPRRDIESSRPILKRKPQTIIAAYELWAISFYE